MNRSTANRLGPVRRAGALPKTPRRVAASSETTRREPDWDAYARLCAVLVGGAWAAERD